MRQLTAVIAAAWLFHVGCFGDADRNNPLDPKAGEFRNQGSISGETVTYFTPFLPVPEATIVLQPAGRLTVSDADGRFSFLDVPTGKYLLTATKGGYAQATDSVEVRVAGNASSRLNLDALPTIDSLTVTSVHLRRPPPNLDVDFFLQVTARIGDADGDNDVTLAVVEVPTLTFRDTLSITQTVGRFQKQIPAASFPGGLLQPLLGQQIFLLAYDRAGNVSRSDPVSVARVISETPQLVSPIDFDFADSRNPVLTWRAMDLPFISTFTVDVVRFEFGLEDPVWSQSQIEGSATSIQVVPTLIPAVYKWTLSVVDEFGNFSKSTQPAFRVN